MRLDLKNPKHNEFVAYFLGFHFWTGDTDLLFDWLYDEDIEDLGYFEKLAKEIFKEFNIQTTPQLVTFIEENQDILYDESLLIWSCKTDLERPTRIRSTVKAALENMYMFGGMGRPNPEYDRYLNNMIEMIMKTI